MQTISDPGTLARACAHLRASGRRIAFVPTMGFLHEGHLSLLREGRRRGDVLVLSIFVNPTQFAPHEDLARYPRDLEGDLLKAEACGVDLVFVPSAEAMYPPGAQTFVEVRELSRPLCGASRPGHFTGVATVVAKLFNLVRPQVALFGQKDYQQLLVIRQMASDLDFPVEIVGRPIVREPDGLALSSRNAYLSTDERRRALCLSQGLGAARARFEGGERDPARLVAAARAVIEQGATRIDYVELLQADTLAAPERVDPGTRVVLAVGAFFGSTRLIDNTVLEA
ncbi:MAG TPA: pantoate--beta-alanine ligase [Polyangia bacterium]|nr:pantoate--beta-alanine ligase [Polyangia bacterium]